MAKPIPKKSIEDLNEVRYSNDGTPYTSVAAANAAILEADRTIGLTVNIANVEYWWKDVLTDVGLVVKTADISSKEDVGVAQGLLTTHETTHPIPTTRDARNQVAGNYEPAIELASLPRTKIDAAFEADLEAVEITGGETQVPSETLDLAGVSMLTIALTADLTVTSVTNMASGGTMVIYEHNGYSLTVLGISGFNDYGNGEYHVKLMNFSASLSGKVRVYDGVASNTSSYTATAMAVFARKTNMTTPEKIAFNALILSQSSVEGGNGNWEYFDEFYDFNVASDTDALIGCKFKTMTKSGTVTKISGGYNFLGGHLLTDFIPSVDGVQWDYSIPDMMDYVHIVTAPADARAMVLGTAADNTYSLYEYDNQVRGGFLGAIKTYTPTNFADDTSHGRGRWNSSFYKNYIDGVEDVLNGATETANITTEILVGAGSVTDVFDGVLSCYGIGGFDNSGFDFAAWDTAYRAYRTALGF